MAGIDFYLGITDDAGANLTNSCKQGSKPTALPLKLAFSADSSDEECPKWIQLRSWSFGASNPGKFGIGSGAGSGKVNMQDFHFTMHPSAATPELIAHVCNGKHFENAFVIAKKTGGQMPVHYMRYWFSKIVISSYQTGSGGGDPEDSVSFNFGALTTSFTPQSSSGAPLASIEKAWNVVRGIPDDMKIDDPKYK